MKKRLVGAAVLISLLVILLPLAFKGPVEPTVEEVPLILPQPPFKALAIPEQKTFETVDQIEPLTDTTVPTDIPAGMEEGAVDASIAISLPVNTPAPTPMPTPSPNPTTTPSVTKSPVVVPAQSKPAKLVPIKEGWVVQVGSFSSLANAEKLQSALLKHQIVTVVSPFQVGKNIFHRVRIMPPVDNKSAAEAMSKKIGQAHKLDTRVVSFDG